MPAALPSKLTTMKVNWSKLFSLSVTDNEYFHDNQDKIEMIGSKKDHHVCLTYLPEINRLLKESDIYYRDRDYTRSIEALEKAYENTMELQNTECFKCAGLFLSTIVTSLEEMNRELQRMSKGLFHTDRYQSSSIKTERLLIKYKNTGDLKSESFFIRKKEKLSYLQPA
jgi:hypothetical protein